MCQVWKERGLDLSFFTCLPTLLGGPGSESSRATGYGIATTAIRLSESYFKRRNIKGLHFLLDALGGVGFSTIEALTRVFKVPSENIVAFDPKEERCKLAEQRYGLTRTFTLSHKEFYSNIPSDTEFDVWINNGPGGNTTAEHVQALLDSGVRLFCGAANNLLQMSSRHASLQKIFQAGAWVWPDEAASGGGWTLAVMDIYRRSQGQRADDSKTEAKILETITSRNANLVSDVLQRLGDAPAGKEVWEHVNSLIDARVAKTLSLSIEPAQLAQIADVRTWAL
jgi:glutamate dehydrogenase/leucine dehydrogenase